MTLLKSWNITSLLEDYIQQSQISHQIDVLHESQNSMSWLRCNIQWSKTSQWISLFFIILKKYVVSFNKSVSYVRDLSKCERVNMMLSKLNEKY